MKADEFTKLLKRIGYLSQRFQDEYEFEDVDQYIDNITKNFPKVENCVIRLNSSKTKFSMVSFTVQGTQYQAKVNRKTIKLYTIQ